MKTSRLPSVLFFAVILTLAASAGAGDAKSPGPGQSQLVKDKAPSGKSTDPSMARLPIDMKLEQEGRRVILRLTRDAEVEVWVGRQLAQECTMGAKCDVTEAVKKAAKGNLGLVCRDSDGNTYKKTVPTATYAHLFEPTKEKAESQRLDRKLGRDHPRVRTLETSSHPSETHVRDIELQPELSSIKVPGAGEVDDTDPNPGMWSVRGRITDAEGKPSEGLTVSLFDKDLTFDDLLGVTVTDSNGDFDLVYGDGDFRELTDSNPDLYLEVRDQDGQMLHSSRDSVRFEATREEVFNIKLGQVFGGAPRATGRVPPGETASDAPRKGFGKEDIGATPETQ